MDNAVVKKPTPRITVRTSRTVEQVATGLRRDAVRTTQQTTVVHNKRAATVVAVRKDKP